MNEIPKPIFLDDNELKINTNLNSNNLFSPPSSPSRFNLSSEDKKSLKIFLNLIHQIEDSSDRLYDFCCHNYDIKLSSLVKDFLDKQKNKFIELQNQIKSQSEVDKSLSESHTPQPVSFSISNWKNLSNDEWPISNPQNWINSAEWHIKGPKLSPESPKKINKSLEERLQNANQKRLKIENLKKLEIRKQTNKVRKVLEKKILAKEEAELILKTKQDNAIKRREEILNLKKEKAHIETEKINEQKYIQELETEGLKILYERKFEKISKRHEEMIKKAQERAHERANLKGSPNKIKKLSNRFMKNNSMTLLESIGCGQLPGILFIEEDISDSDDYIIKLPEIIEKTPIFSQQLQNLIQRIINDPNDIQLTLKCLKMISDQSTIILMNSELSEIISKQLQNLILENSPLTEQIIRHINNLLNKGSIGFSFKISIVTISMIKNLCEKQDSLRNIKEMISLWTNLLNLNISNEFKSFLIEKLCHSIVFDRLCFLLSSVSFNDLSNDLLKLILDQIISLFKSISLIFLNNNNLEKLKLSFSESLDRIIGPSLITFLLMMSINLNEFTLKLITQISNIISTFTIEFPDTFTNFLDEQTASSALKVIKSILNHSNYSTSETSHELIVLFGLLCKYSNIMRESCFWGPLPTVLSLLCKLPLGYFIKKPLNDILIPTLISCCINSEINLNYILENINGTLILKYLQKEFIKNNDIFNPYYRINLNEINNFILKFSKKL